MIRRQDVLAFAVFVLIAAIAAIVAYILLPQSEPVPSSTTLVAKTYTITPTVVILEKRAKEARVVVDVATLRAGPGVESDRIGSLQRGEIVIVVGASLGEDWYLVKLPNPQDGIDQAWIAAEFVEFVTVTPTFTPTSTSVTEPTVAEPVAQPTPLPSATPRPRPVATQPPPPRPTNTPKPEPPTPLPVKPSDTPEPVATTPVPPPEPTDIPEPPTPTDTPESEPPVTKEVEIGS